MLEKILVTTDFSPTDRAVVSKAVALAKQLGAGELTLYHAHVPPTLTDFGVSAPLGKENEMRDEVEKRLGQWSEELSTSDVKVATKTTAGRPAHAIIECSADYDLIVMGSRGHGRAHRFLLGSTAERVMRGATCDVWLVRVDGEAD